METTIDEHWFRQEKTLINQEEKKIITNKILGDSKSVARIDVDGVDYNIQNLRIVLNSFLQP